MHARHGAGDTRSSASSNARSPIACSRADAADARESVEKIEHARCASTKNSCESNAFRVTMRALQSACSIERRSNTTLTSDSCQRQVLATAIDKTPRSCGALSPRKSATVSDSQRSPSSFPTALVRCTRAVLRARSRARRAGFISVSGQCAARSALSSDQRNSKRSSGGVAATEHLRAPMNSPSQSLARRVSYPRSVARH